MAPETTLPLSPTSPSKSPIACLPPAPDCCLKSSGVDRKVRVPSRGPTSPPGRPESEFSSIAQRNTCTPPAMPAALGPWKWRQPGCAGRKGVSSWTPNAVGIPTRTGTSSGSGRNLSPSSALAVACAAGHRTDTPSPGQNLGTLASTPDSTTCRCRGMHDSHSSPRRIRWSNRTRT